MSRKRRGRIPAEHEHRWTAALLSMVKVEHLDLDRLPILWVHSDHGWADPRDVNIGELKLMFSLERGENSAPRRLVDKTRCKPPRKGYFLWCVDFEDLVADAVLLDMVRTLSGDPKAHLLTSDVSSHHLYGGPEWGYIVFANNREVGTRYADTPSEAIVMALQYFGKHVASFAHGVNECTPADPMPRGAPGRWSHEGAAEFGEQRDGFPGGGIVTMRCRDCETEWEKELPQ